jgi:soluble lytic murein transglycosylase
MTSTARNILSVGVGMGVLAAVIFGLLVGVDYWRDRSIEERIDRFNAAIAQASRESDLPVGLIRALIRAESSGEPDAVSRTGAKGLMQVSSDAEQDVLARLKIPRGDLFNGDYNVRIGSAYLRQMMNRYDGDLYLSLAAYNMGPGKVTRIRQEHPELTGRQIVEQFIPAGTRQYCQQIVRGAEGKLPK